MSERTASEWYVLVEGQQVGPKPLQEMQEMVRQGKLSPDHQVWAAGMASWRSARDVSGLFKPPLAPTGLVAPVSSEASPGALGSAVTQQSELIKDSQDEKQIFLSPDLDRVDRENAPSDKISGNYFVRHWRGDLGLGISYWLNSFLANIASLTVFGIGLGLLTAHVDEGLTFSFVVLNIMLAVFAVISAWQIVGTWRSANKHTSRGGVRGWAIAAQIMLFLGVCRLIMDLGANGLPVYLRMSELLFVEEPKKVFSVEYAPSQKALVVSGDIKIGSFQILSSALERHPDVQSLVLKQSPGGWINEAEKAAKLVRDKGLATVASGQCVSACSIIFTAGTQRWITQDGRIGLHAPRNPVVGTTDEDDVRKMERALTAYGMPAEIAHRGVSTPSASMWYPTSAEVQKSGFTRGLLDEELFLKSGQLVVKSALDSVQASLLKMPVYVALSKADPASFSAIVKALTAFMDTEKSDVAKGVERVRPLFLRSIYKFVPLSTSETVIDLAKVNLGYLERLQRDNLPGCVALSDPSKRPPLNVDLSVYPDLAAREMELYARAVAEGSRNPARVPAEAELSADYNALGAMLRQKFPSKLALIDKPKIDEAELSDYCDIQIQIYREIVNGPRDRSDRLLRYMYSGLVK